MKKKKAEILKLLTLNSSSSFRARKTEPFESLFNDISEIYNEYVSLVSMTECGSNSDICNDEYLRDHLRDRGLRKESVRRVLLAVKAELNNIADEDAKELSKIKKENDSDADCEN